MTSTMSLAARICSRVLEENKPAIYASRMPDEISGSKCFRRVVARASRPCVQIRTGETPVPQLLGHLLGRSPFESLVFGHRAFDQQKAEAVAYIRTGKGLFKNLRLETVTGGKEIAAVDVVLELQLIIDFFARIKARIDE